VEKMIYGSSIAFTRLCRWVEKNPRVLTKESAKARLLFRTTQREKGEKRKEKGK